LSYVPIISFAIIINDVTLDSFRPGRALQEVKYSKAFKGIKMGRTLYISHLLFVGDIILFCDGSRRDVLKIREILNLDCLITSMMLNVGNL
jgi:hypothetical protein